jgi:hypothetical protein
MLSRASFIVTSQKVKSELEPTAILSKEAQ